MFEKVKNSFASFVIGALLASTVIFGTLVATSVLPKLQASASLISSK